LYRVHLAIRCLVIKSGFQSSKLEQDKYKNVHLEFIAAFH
jgi:hypothetical protein